MDERLNNLLEMIEQNKNNEYKDAVKFGPYLLENKKDSRIRKVVSDQGGYIVRYYLGKTDQGKNRYLTRHVETYRDAQKLCSELSKQISNGEDTFYKIKLDKAMEDYTNSVSFHNRAVTYQVDMKQKKAIVSRVLGRRIAKDITVSDIEAFYREKMGLDADGNVVKQEGAVTYQSVNRYKAFLSNIWNFMVHEGKYGVTHNIIRDTVIPEPTTKVNGVLVKAKKKNYVAKSLTIDELNITLNDCLLNEPDGSFVMLVILGAVAGLRKSEILGLRASRLLREDDDQVNVDNLRSADCNPDFYQDHKELVLIDQAIAVVPGQEIMKLPKDDKPRIIAVPDILLQVLKRAVDQRRKLMDTLQEHGALSMEKDYDFAFYPLLNITEDRKRPVNIDGMWVKYQKRRNDRLISQGLPEIEQIRLHDLRHTHANLLRLGGVPEYEISKNMGHSITGSVTRTNYFDDYRPNRKEIIDYFDSHIHLDFEKYDNEPHNFI